MRGFGRQCRGQGKVFVKLVRQTETRLLEVGSSIATRTISGLGRGRSTIGTIRYQSPALPAAVRARSVKDAPRIDPAINRRFTGLEFVADETSGTLRAIERLLVDSPEG